jgi:hypothetical protein
MNFWNNKPSSTNAVQAIPNYQVVHSTSNLPIVHQNQAVYNVPINPPPYSHNLPVPSAPPYSHNLPVPSAPPMPIKVTTAPLKTNLVSGNKLENVEQTLDVETFKRSILYPLERSLFKLLQDNEFGLYPTIKHITILETKSCKITPGVFFVKLHLEIISGNNESLVSHCIHVRVRKNTSSYQLERVLPNMTENDELSFLSAKNK